MESQRKDKRARHLSLVIENKSLPLNFCDRVCEVFSSKDYKVVHQAWIESIEEENKTIKGYLSFEKPTGYSTGKFKSCLSILFQNHRVKIDPVTNTLVLFIEMLKMDMNTLQQKEVDISDYVDNRTKHISTKTPRLLEKIQEGEITSLQEIKQINIDCDLPDMNYMRSKRFYQEEIREALETNHRQSLGVWDGIKESVEWGEGWYKMCVWANETIKKDLCNRKKHLWVYGPSGMGKSTRFLDPLKERLRTWQILKDPVQNLPYVTGNYDLIYVDEYNHPYKHISFLQEITNPQKPGVPGMRIRQQGGTTHEKNDFPPVIVISNQSIRDLYKGADKVLIKTLEERFYQVYIGNRGNPFSLDEEDDKSQNQLDERMFSLPPTLSSSSSSGSFQWISESGEDTESRRLLMKKRKEFEERQKSEESRKRPKTSDYSKEVAKELLSDLDISSSSERGMEEKSPPRLNTRGTPIQHPVVTQRVMTLFSKKTLETQKEQQVEMQKEN